MRELQKNDSLKEILRSNDKVLIDFYADWCGPCKLLKPVLAEIEKATKDVVFLCINVEEHEELAMEYTVSSIPLLVMYKGGEEVGRRIGFQTHDQIIKLLNKS